MENLPENFSYPRGSFNMCIRRSFEQLLEKEKEKKNDERKAKPLQKPRTFSQSLISFDHAPSVLFSGLALMFCCFFPCLLTGCDYEAFREVRGALNGSGLLIVGLHVTHIS